MIRLDCENYEEMCRVAADMIASQLMEKKDSVLGLATGSTPVGIYEILCKMNSEGKIDFSEVRTVNLDEYIGLPPENEQSYHYFMNSNLLDHININKANTHIPDGMAEDPEVECERYDKLIRDLGGIDLQLLGIGGNGHIGFNEPGDEFVKPTNCTRLTARTIEDNSRFFEDESMVPRRAITLGMGAIFKARKVILVANGPKKLEIMKKAVFGPITPKVPASVLQLHPDITYLYSPI